MAVLCNIVAVLHVLLIRALIRARARCSVHFDPPSISVAARSRRFVCASVLSFAWRITRPRPATRETTERNCHLTYGCCTLSFGSSSPSQIRFRGGITDQRLIGPQ